MLAAELVLREVVLEREDLGRVLADIEAGPCDHGRDEALKAEVEERELALDDRPLRVRDRVEKGRDGAHQALRALGRESIREQRHAVS